ncbi:DUF2163 domain-containing protein [Methylosinus sp. Sm6]|uniref:DUF2163 domain-containing protein n=1 Tax=Methylosinus sp. Sm6 TaxID=2866948 RepID=UPI001C99F58D|nr:DUF2163 domain-containing protein [Methylosinus sp. Sm6]
MKTLSSALAAHLAGGATTMAYCWRVTRRDSTVLGFTEHDEDIVCDGTTFLASSGFAASQIQTGLGLSVDNFTAAGALSSGSISETDILAGRYDDAALDLLWVNWADPTQFIVVSSGHIGEIKRAGLAFTAEFRSLASRLGQKIGGTYQRTCSATLGDSKCRIDLTRSELRGTATVQTAGLVRRVVVTGIGSFAADWFTHGRAAFSTGANAGLAIEVKKHLRSAGQDVFELWTAPPFALSIGDTAVVTAGCAKSFAACRTKFGNQANFRGFPHIPGSDHVMAAAKRGASNQNGGSIFG